MMQIKLNNRDEKINANYLTVRDLLEKKKYTFPYFIVKINGKLIKKEEYDKAVINDGDDVKVLHMMAGG